MSTDPVQDADDHFAAQDAHTKRIRELEEMYREQIMDVFTKHIRTVSVDNLSVPIIDNHSSSIAKKSELLLTDAIFEVINGDIKSCTRLLRVLEKSDCPYVQKLRKSLGKNHADSWAPELAELMA